MKTKWTVMMVTLLLLVGVLAGCSSNAVSAKKYAPEVNLKNMYTVKDPKDVSYDTRYAMYKPVLKSDDDYAGGMRYSFTVIYAKQHKGQYMYSVNIFETEKQAEDYKATAGSGTVDKKAYVKESGADMFAKMESFVPTADDWVKNMKESGMMDLKQ